MNKLIEVTGSVALNVDANATGRVIGFEIGSGLRKSMVLMPQA
jgi:hypothetical protein